MFGELFALAALLSYGAMLYKVVDDRNRDAASAQEFADAVVKATQAEDLVVPADAKLAETLQRAAQQTDGESSSVDDKEEGGSDA
jgi:hypothetical protein